MTIPRRRIGTTGPEVSVFSLGSWHTYDRMDFHDGAELLKRAVDAGIDLFDLGVYGGVPVDGQIHHVFTDVLFGRMMEQAGIPRHAYKISEKLWLENWPAQPLADQLDRALFRIGAGHADLAVLGDIRTDDIDLRALVTELSELVRSGRLGAWGVNNWSVRNLRFVHDFAVSESLETPQLAQLKYSLCRRSIAEGDPFRSLFAETGIGLQASDIFEGGILAGRTGSDRMVGRDPGGLRTKIQQAAAEATGIARVLGATPAQLGIAFCLTNPSVANILFGVSRLEQLEDNLAALDLLKRHENDLRALTAGLWLDRDIVDPAGP